MATREQKIKACEVNIKLFSEYIEDYRKLRENEINKLKGIHSNDNNLKIVSCDCFNVYHKEALIKVEESPIICDGFDITITPLFRSWLNPQEKIKDCYYCKYCGKKIEVEND